MSRCFVLIDGRFSYLRTGNPFPMWREITEQTHCMLCYQWEAGIENIMEYHSGLAFRESSGRLLNEYECCGLVHSSYTRKYRHSIQTSWQPVQYSQSTIANWINSDYPHYNRNTPSAINPPLASFPRVTVLYGGGSAVVSFSLSLSSPSLSFYFVISLTVSFTSFSFSFPWFFFFFFNMWNPSVFISLPCGLTEEQPNTASRPSCKALCVPLSPSLG